MVFSASSKATNISCNTFPMRSYRCAQLLQPSKVSSHSHLFLQRSDRETRLESGNGSTDFTRIWQPVIVANSVPLAPNTLLHRGALCDEDVAGGEAGQRGL